MPNLTTVELAVVATCFLFFWGVPAFLNVLQQRRRRLAERVAAVADGTPYVVTPEVPPGAQEPRSAEPSAGDDTSAFAEEMAAHDVGEEPSPAPAASRTGCEWLEFAADETPGAAGRTIVRLGDLRRASLANWPPEPVRNDPADAQRWLQAERAAARHAVAVEDVELSVPVPVRSCCFAGGEEAGTVWRVRFLLFSDLWPEQEEQADALAIFDIDGQSGSVSARVATRGR